MVRSPSHTSTAEAKWHENLSQPPPRGRHTTSEQTEGQADTLYTEKLKSSGGIITVLLSQNIEFYVHTGALIKGVILVLDLCSCFC